MASFPVNSLRPRLSAPSPTSAHLLSPTFTPASPSPLKQCEAKNVTAMRAFAQHAYDHGELSAAIDWSREDVLRLIDLGVARWMNWWNDASEALDRRHSPRACKRLFLDISSGFLRSSFASWDKIPSKACETTSNDSLLQTPPPNSLDLLRTDEVYIPSPPSSTDRSSFSSSRQQPLKRRLLLDVAHVILKSSARASPVELETDEVYLRSPPSSPLKRHRAITESLLYI